MPTNVIELPIFEKNLTSLARKYPSVMAEVNQLIEQLETDERPGDKIPNVGYDVYKVRLRNRAARKGKSGGFRVIYYVRLADHVALLTIYSKSQQTDIAPERIQQIIEDYLAQDENDNQ
jgi:mRNA-degrading endonuclease RelE of RelBE toxin-antitoxin system